MSNPNNHLKSIWYHSEHSYVPYTPKPVSWLELFCHFLKQTSSSMDLPYQVVRNFVNRLIWKRIFSVSIKTIHGQIYVVNSETI
jgi:hypothetical protein